MTRDQERGARRRDLLAIHGGPRSVTAPSPHFVWPPPMPELGAVVSRYIETQQPLSIIDRSGIYEELESLLCELHGRRFALLVSSGTMALYSAFFGLDLKEGDEVISTVFSFHATASPLLHLGVRVRFCDVEPDTGNIDPERLREMLHPGVRAVVTNDTWGHPVDKASIRALCREHGAAWVEDCSHAHFAEYDGRRVGTFGDVAVFSLQGNKLVTGGEGGVLLTDDEEVYRRVTLLGHGLGRSAEAARGTAYAGLERSGFGLKLRMHPLAAVIVRHVLDRHCFDWLAERHGTLERFSQGLAGTGVVLPMARRPYVTSMGAHYGFKPRLDLAALGVPRQRLVEALRAEGLEVSVPASLPFHRLALFDADRFRVNRFDKVDHARQLFLGADHYVASTLSLPTFTFQAQWPLVDQYVAAFEKVLEQREELG